MFVYGANVKLFIAGNSMNYNLWSHYLLNLLPCWRYLNRYPESSNNTRKYYKEWQETEQLRVSLEQ